MRTTINTYHKIEDTAETEGIVFLSNVDKELKLKTVTNLGIASRWIYCRA